MSPVFTFIMHTPPSTSSPPSCWWWEEITSNTHAIRKRGIKFKTQFRENNNNNNNETNNKPPQTRLYISINIKIWKTFQIENNNVTKEKTTTTKKKYKFTRRKKNTKNSARRWETRCPFHFIRMFDCVFVLLTTAQSLEARN